MELEELKSKWQEMSRRVESQALLTNQILQKITREKYRSKINTIGYSEYIGTIICYTGAAYIIINFAKIDDFLMQICALLIIALLFILPVISLKSFREVSNMDIFSQTYVRAIEDFAKRKASFQKLQRLNVLLAMFLLLLSIPVLSSIQGKAITQTPQFWTVIVPATGVFFLVFAFWVLRVYNRVLTGIEQMLSENELK
ncbi:MAG TPA: hypothetical protein PKC30_16610 [Saprospiraceae bacterium]|nr:hypothetical protein [Saprospiraceae bacterium]